MSRAVVITGAANGIGAACTRLFADEGWAVVAVDRDESALTALSDPGVTPLVGDVTDPEVNRRAVAMAVELHGGLDGFVANAGVTLAKQIDDTTAEEFDRLFAVNVKAIMLGAQAAHRPLAERRGVFVVMASKTGLVAQTDSPIYVATKGAAIQLARALALDWAPEGIRVNAVCPGIVDTPMLAEYLDALPDPERARASFATAQPLGRLATPEECAQAALWLASPRASFVTGVALPVDGGFTAA